MNCPIAVSTCTRGIAPSAARAWLSRCRYGGQPAGDRAQPVTERREVAGQQRVDGGARVGDQRVPLGLAQLLELRSGAPRRALRRMSASTWSAG